MQGQRETHKDLTLFERRWRVKKFNPLSGSYVIMKVASKLGSMMGAFMGGSAPTKEYLLMAVFQALGGFDEQEIGTLQHHALNVCYELQITEPGSPPVEIPLLAGNGAWGPAGVADDTMLVLMLTAHAIVFNLTPFFDDARLRSAGESFKMYLSLFPTQTSTGQPSPPSPPVPGANTTSGTEPTL